MIYRFPARVGRERLSASSAALLARLVEAGITRSVAEKLVRQYPDRIAEQVEYLPYRSAQDPAALLVEAIRSGWQPPALYLQAQAEAEEARQEAEERRQVEARRREQERKRRERTDRPGDGAAGAADHRIRGRLSPGTRAPAADQPDGSRPPRVAGLRGPAARGRLRVAGVRGVESGMSAWGSVPHIVQTRQDPCRVAGFLQAPRQLRPAASGACSRGSPHPGGSHRTDPPRVRATARSRSSAGRNVSPSTGGSPTRILPSPRRGRQYRRAPLRRRGRGSRHRLQAATGRAAQLQRRPPPAGRADRPAPPTAPLLLPRESPPLPAPAPAPPLAVPPRPPPPPPPGHARRSPAPTHSPPLAVPPEPPRPG